jgi:hypothetical protein
LGQPMKTRFYVDEFAVLKMADLYRHLLGPKGDRLCRYHPDPPGYRLTWQQGDDVLSIECRLQNQRLFIRTSLMTDSIEVDLTSYRQGVYGGAARYAFSCPGCSRRVFHLFVPPPSRLTRPDGSASRNEPLCLHCHGLSYPSWRYGGPSKERAALQRRTLAEKLGDQPIERQPGCSVTRHLRRLNRLLRAEGRLLTAGDLSGG